MIKKLLRLSLPVLLLGFSSSAFAAQNTVAPLTPKEVKSNPNLILKSDLKASITGSYDQAGAKPFQNGATLASGGVIPTEWIHVKIENLGAGVAGNFNTDVTVTGANTTSPLTFQTASLNAGESFQKDIEVITNGMTHHVTVFVKTDTANKVNETNEGNNSARFIYTVKNVK
ncbi:MAG: hypothetical protein FDX30_05370 [Chlorobium sp.]|nr:MAG: hypothetical protein FDX30_05370 [Chlorobium sp.]